jgi:hypothetical protein
MQIQEVINHIAAGDSVAAKESIENILSAKAFDALQSRKQEIASTLFGGQEQMPEEVTDDEELAYEEDVEVDGEQLDEVSMKLATYVNRRRKEDAEGFSVQGGNSPARDKQYTKSGEHKSNISARAILKKPGGETRLKRINKLHMG